MKAPLIINVGGSGLRLEGGRRMVADLIPGDSLQGRHTPVDLLAVFVLPGVAPLHGKVKVLCNSVYIRETSPDCWHIGMRFTAFDQGRSAVDSFLSSKGVRT